MVWRVFHVSERRDHGLAVLGMAQRGTAHRSQLREIGFSSRAADHRVAAGALHPIFHATFAIGHPDLPPLGLETAALLSVGNQCVLSHASAAAIWGFAPPAPVAVITAINRHPRPQPGLDVHRVSTLDLRDVRLHHGLPVTAPARTLIDRAGHITQDQLDRELNQARVLKLVTDTDTDIHTAIDRCPGRTGIGPLRALLASQHGPSLTRSEAERRFQHIIEHGQLPWPQFNVYLHHKQVDLLWPQLQLIVEIDGYATHSPRAAFERDRHRDQHLAAQGYTTIRITWRQLTQAPMAVLSNLAQAIARAQALRGL